MGSKDLIRVDLDKPRYDQSTFLGRFKHFIEVTDVRTLFTSPKTLQESLDRLDDYKKKGSPPVTLNEAEKLYDAKKIKDSIIHPDTGKQIPIPVRLSSFVPINVIICAGMLLPNPSMGSVIFWQWINQSYNIALNHANRNASNELSNETILKTYLSAVAISCGVAVGLGKGVQKAPFFSPVVRNTLMKFVPFTAVATAGVANVFMMRWNEVKEGIMVKDENGNDLGKSGKAGFNALSQVAFSRIMTSFPVLLFPPMIMSFAEKMEIVRRNPRLITPINLGVIATMLWTALPAAVAIFPQIVTSSPKDLEPSFHNLKDRNGKPIETVYYNRGL